MTQLDKISPVPGPHHCFAAGKRARDWVFEAIIKEADKHNGIINRLQIEELRHAFANSKNVAFDAATDVHNFCMKSYDRKNIGLFDKTVIFKFLIKAYISDLLPTVFPQQHKIACGKWGSIFSDFAADRIQSRVRTDVFTEYYDLYQAISTSKGRNFSAADLTDNHDIHVLTKSVIEQTKKMLADQENISIQLCAELNTYLLQQTYIDNTRLLFAKNRQISEFLTAVSKVKSGNTFRAKVQRIKLKTPDNLSQKADF